LIVLWGVSGLQKSVDLRDLYRPQKDLLAAEKFFSDIMGAGSRPVFFLVTGEDMEEILKNEEKLRSHLDSLITRDAIKSYKAISQLVPSIKTQEENYAAISEVFYEELETLQKLLGFDEALKEHTIAFFTDQAGKYVRPQDILFLNDDINVFILEGIGNLVMLDRVQDWEALKTLQNEKSYLLDRVGELNSILETYWKKALIINIAAYLVIAFFLLLRYVTD
jgi:hypothetical protein